MADATGECYTQSGNVKKYEPKKFSYVAFCRVADIDQDKAGNYCMYAYKYSIMDIYNHSYMFGSSYSKYNVTNDNVISYAYIHPYICSYDTGSTNEYKTSVLTIETSGGNNSYVNTISDFWYYFMSLTHEKGGWTGAGTGTFTGGYHWSPTLFGADNSYFTKAFPWDMTKRLLSYNKEVEYNIKKYSYGDKLFNSFLTYIDDGQFTNNLRSFIDLNDDNKCTWSTQEIEITSKPGNAPEYPDFLINDNKGTFYLRVIGDNDNVDTDFTIQHGTAIDSKYDTKYKAVKVTVDFIVYLPKYYYYSSLYVKFYDISITFYNNKLEKYDVLNLSYLDEDIPVSEFVNDSYTIQFEFMEESISSPKVDDYKFEYAASGSKIYKMNEFVNDLVRNNENYMPDIIIATHYGDEWVPNTIMSAYSFFNQPNTNIYVVGTCPYTETIPTESFDVEMELLLNLITPDELNMSNGGAIYFNTNFSDFNNIRIDASNLTKMKDEGLTYKTIITNTKQNDRSYGNVNVSVNTHDKNYKEVLFTGTPEIFCINFKFPGCNVYNDIYDGEYLLDIDTKVDFDMENEADCMFDLGVEENGYGKLNEDKDILKSNGYYFQYENSPIKNFYNYDYFGSDKTNIGGYTRYTIVNDSDSCTITAWVCLSVTESTSSPKKYYLADTASFSEMMNKWKLSIYKLSDPKKYIYFLPVDFI